MSIEYKAERGVIIGLFVLVALVASHFLGPIFGTAVLISMFLAGLIIGNSRMLVMVYLGWASVMALVADYTKVVDYADEGFFVLCCVSLMMNFIRFRRSAPDLQQIKKLFSLLLMVCVASTIFNGITPIVSFHYYISYLSFIPVFLLARTCVRDGDSEKAFKVVVWFFVLQVILNVGWAMHFNPLRNRIFLSGGGAALSDFAIGTLMGSNHVAYFSVMVLFILYNYFMNPIKQGSPKVSIFLVLIVFFQIYISDSAHVYPMLVVAGLLHVFLIRRNAKEVLAVCVCGVLFLGVFSAYDAYRGGATGGAYSQARTLSYKSVRNRIERLKDNPKGVMTADILKRTHRVGFVKTIVGEGPGGVLSTVAMSRVTEAAKAYLGKFYFTYSGRQSLASSSIMDQPVTGFIAVLSELGLLGTGLYLAIYIYAFVRILRQVRSGLYHDRYQYTLAASFPVILSVWGMMNVLVDLLYIDFFQIGVWVLAALVWTPMAPKNSLGESPRSDEESLEAVPAQMGQIKG